MTIDYRAPDDDTQAFLLAKYLPHGRLWNAKWTRGRVLGRLVFAFSKEIGRLFEIVEKFTLQELDPAKTRELILEWEQSVGIPDQCFGRPIDLATRRLRIQQKLANFDDPITRADFDAFMDSFQQVVEFVPGSADNAEKLGFGIPPYTTQELKEVRHTLAVRVESDAQVFPLPFPISFNNAGASLLQCLISRLAPAHINLAFFFNEDLGQPFVTPTTAAPIGTVARSSTVQSITTTQQNNLALPSVARGSTVNPLTVTEQSSLALPTVSRSGSVVQPITLANSIVQPSSIAGLELHLTATIPNTTTWVDQSSAGNSVTQATSARRPTVSTVNGNASLLFDGDVQATSDLMRDSSASITSPPGTIALAFTPTSVAAGLADIVKFREGFNEIFVIQRNGTGIEIVEGQGGGATVIAIPGVLAVGETRWIIARLRNSGAGVSDLLTDEGGAANASVSAAISTAIDDINIGANANGADAYAGHIHEILYWNAFVSDSERSDIGDYLNSEWTVS